MNNQVHESVGGQETSARFIDIPNIVKSNGYRGVYTANNREQLLNRFDEFLQGKGPGFIEVKVKPGSREDLGRPTIKPVDNKKVFMDFLKG